MVVGIVGNALVLYVNIIVLTLQNSTHRFCTTFLALADITFCIICYPFMIGHLTHPYTFTNTFVSALVLLVIAFDRYRRICRPYGNQFSTSSVQRLFGIIVFLSVIFSVPSLILYGKNTVRTGIANINGTQRFPDDIYNDTLFPNGHIIFLYALFTIATALMSLFNTLVCRQIRKHTRSLKPHALSEATEMSLWTCTTDTSFPEMSSLRPIAETQHNTHEDSKCAGYPGKYISEGSKGNKVKKRTGREKSTRISRILLVATTFFVLSFAPYLSLELLTYFDKTFIETLDNTSTVFYQLFVRTYAINFMLNPFLYHVMDMRFQVECKKLVLKRL